VRRAAPLSSWRSRRCGPFKPVASRPFRRTETARRPRSRRAAGVGDVGGERGDRQACA
jgi:hypothetical protein